MVPLPTLPPPPPSDLLPRRPNRFQRPGLEFAGDEEFPAVAGCGPAPPPPLAAVMVVVGIVVAAVVCSRKAEAAEQSNAHNESTGADDDCVGGQV